MKFLIVTKPSPKNALVKKGGETSAFRIGKGGVCQATGAWFPASAFAAELEGERSAQKYPSAPPMRPANAQEGAASCTKPNYVKPAKAFPQTSSSYAESLYNGGECLRIRSRLKAFNFSTA